jgi:pyrroloquinoline quinone biosynthesis protein D
MKTSLAAADILTLVRRFRLQWEPAQQAHVLLYPEGMVKLSASAGEIIKRLDGERSVEEIILDLEKVFPGAALRDDVLEFLSVAHERGWIETRPR